jgi:hypothetical protein
MRRRAFAMLIVLGVLVVLLSVSASIARARSTRSLAAATHADWVDALTIANSTDDAIRSWLARESSAVVLDPKAGAPFVRVLDHNFIVAGKPIEIRVLAWDQCGMPSTSEIDDLPQDITGLDQISTSGSVYPDDTHPDRLGSRMATHNPIPGSDRRTDSAIMVNVNTASEQRLEDVFRTLGTPLSDQILNARRAGERADTNSIRASRSDRYHLIATSRVWSFRTDVTVDRVRVSLWSVYVKRGGTWALEQRIAIPD